MAMIFIGYAMLFGGIDIVNGGIAIIFGGYDEEFVDENMLCAIAMGFEGGI